MSWLFSRALVEEFWGVTFSAGALSAPSNGSPTPQAFLSPDRTTAFSRLSRFGMTFAPLTDDRGADLLTSYRAGFRARTSASLAEAKDWTENAPASGKKWLASWAKYDRGSSSWKTAQLSFLEVLGESSVTWPRSGLMRRGACYPLRTWEHNTVANESGSWPTPTATDYKSETMSVDLIQRRAQESTRGVRLTEFLQRKMLPTPTAGTSHMGGYLNEWGGSGNPFRGTEVGRLRLNPYWVEELMAWPIGWTELKPLAMARFLEWQQQHSLNSPDFLSEAAA